MVGVQALLDGVSSNGSKENRFSFSVFQIRKLRPRVIGYANQGHEGEIKVLTTSSH